jgi:hypothetical protein
MFPSARRVAIVVLSFALATFAFILAVSGQAAFGQEPLTAKSFEGVWKATRFVSTGANGRTDNNPQPCLTIFYRGYFTIVRDNSKEPRKQSPDPGDPAKPTDAEKIAKYEEWAPFAASAGTYEVKGNTLITHNVLAKQVKGVNLTEEATIKFEGDSFTASGPSGDKQTTYTRVR